MEGFSKDAFQASNCLSSYAQLLFRQCGSHGSLNRQDLRMGVEAVSEPRGTFFRLQVKTVS